MPSHENGHASRKPSADRSIAAAVLTEGLHISNLEVEKVRSKHPAVLIAERVARPNPRWRETPCAFCN